MCHAFFNLMTASALQMRPTTDLELIPPQALVSTSNCRPSHELNENGKDPLAPLPLTWALWFCLIIYILLVFLNFLICFLSVWIFPISRAFLHYWQPYFLILVVKCHSPLVRRGVERVALAMVAGIPLMTVVVVVSLLVVATLCRPQWLGDILALRRRSAGVNQTFSVNDYELYML